MAQRNLKQVFARFLRRQHLRRLFARGAMLESSARAGVSREVPADMAGLLREAALAQPEECLRRLGSQDTGLAPAEADARRLQYGPNDVEHEGPLPWWRVLWQGYLDPFNLLLSLLALVSLLTHDLKAATVIGCMVTLSTLMRFWQQSRSTHAVDALKAMVSSQATVLRPSSPEGLSEHIEMPMAALVPGDVVRLSAGDMVPADCRILSAKDLFVAQSAMTGESMPVEKFLTQRSPGVNNPLELDNIVFMGTNVVSGAAHALVLSTGRRTYFGALAQRVTAVDRSPTSFQTGVNRVSWLLIRFMLVMVSLVLLLNGFTKHDWLQALLFALSVAVGLTPEMLPMIVTSTLAKGAVFLSRKKVIVKRLDAIQNLGAMDVLCTDKTGTLTQDKIVLARHTDVWGNESDEVLRLAYLNSHYQTGLKNLLDVAVLAHSEVMRELDIDANYGKVDEIPFDFSRRRMSVVVNERDHHHELICKGATEEVLAVCTQVLLDGVVTSLTPDLLERIRQVSARFDEEGLRVVSVAMKEEPAQQQVYSVADEAGLTLVGHVAFLDPPRESTAAALKALAGHGIQVKVLTGDNERVTAKVCRDVGLVQGGVLLGGQIESMSDADLQVAVQSHSMFAKLSPQHKERIVRCLQSAGHVVGFMGDGINDAPALRAADVGISVDSGVDIAKEAADIILLEKSLLVLDEGVMEGRRTFANMLKYIRMTASSNFGNVLSVLVASAFIPFLPMLPMHLLVQNLLYDVSQSAIPFDRVDEQLLQAPQQWQPADIGRFMLFFGPVSTVFDVITFVMMWFIFGANSVESQTLFQSGWFVVGLLTQTVIVHMIRTPLIPLLQSRAARPLSVMTLGIAVTGIFLPMGPLAHYFKLQPLPALYFWLLPLILLAYAGLTQGMKVFYRSRYGWH